MTNKNDLVVLGLLFEQDRYGYEIIQEVKRRDFEHWANINPASIYNHLNRLEESGALSSHMEKVGKYPERKVYSITEEGRRRLSDMVVEALASDSYADDSIECLGIGFVYCADEEAVLQSIQNKVVALEELIGHLTEEGEEYREHIPLNWLLLLELTVAYVKMKMNILHRLEDAIKSGTLAESIERAIASEGL